MLTDTCVRCVCAVPLGQVFCPGCVTKVSADLDRGKCWSCRQATAAGEFCEACGEPLRNDPPVLINALPETRIYSKTELREATLRMVDAVADA